MQASKVLNYRVHIEKEGSGKKAVYNAFCPTLGLTDFGRTIDEALQHMNELIEFHIEALSKLGRAIPREQEDATTVITSVSVSLSRSAHFTNP